jgi:hypothetical protein
MIVARPHTLFVRAWNGRKFESKSFPTADYDFAENQIPANLLAGMPLNMALQAKAFITFRPGSRHTPAIVTNDLEDIYSQLAPRFESNPVAPELIAV